LIPYWQQAALRIGPFTFYAFGILLVVATVVGSAMFVKRAEAISLSGKTAWRLILLLVPSGFLGAHLMYCALEDRDALFQFGGISSFGGGFAGVLVLASCVISLPGLADQRWRWFDAASYSAVFAGLIARVGCFLAHDHLGVRTSAWISVKYSDGSRYDLALLEVIFLAVLALVLVVGNRQSWFRYSGFTFGVTAFSYGWFRFSLDYLQEMPRRYHGLTAEQYGALALVGLSFGGFWAANNRRSNHESKRYDNPRKFVGVSESSIG